MTLGPVRDARGGEGEASSLAGEILHVVLGHPYAPGAPISLRLTRSDGELSLEGRTIGSKRREDGRYDVRLRLVNLTREHRARLAT
ncbi:MAG: hypothetical protein M3Y87_17310 [Myxococcota bacterium]|nr:hypothetical protein [Myxococcota bacterium]